MTTFSENFKDLLIEKGVTVKSIASEIGINSSTLYKYLSSTMPRIENAVKIANYFDCSLNFLVGIDTLPKQTHFSKAFDPRIFFNRYKELLKDSGLTHYKFCKLAKINSSSHSAWRQGTLPYLDKLELIAKYFGSSIDYLVGREQ